MVQLFGPALALLARITMAFAFAFLVPLAWAWFEDAESLRTIWGACFGLTFGSGWLLWLLTRAHRRELLARDGFLLVNLVWLLLPAFAAENRLEALAHVPPRIWIGNAILTPFVLLVGLFTDRGRLLHDLLLGTAAVRTY